MEYEMNMKEVGNGLYTPEWIDSTKKATMCIDKYETQMPNSVNTDTQRLQSHQPINS